MVRSFCKWHDWVRSYKAEICPDPSGVAQLAKIGEEVTKDQIHAHSAKWLPSLASMLINVKYQHLRFYLLPRRAYKANDWGTCYTRPPWRHLDAFLGVIPTSVQPRHRQKYDRCPDGTIRMLSRRTFSVRLGLGIWALLSLERCRQVVSVGSHSLCRQAAMLV